jgi:DNA repair exonuclease SbcCD ATPase subunit
MSNKVRDTLGKFAPKSEVPRKIRSVNLTDDAWQWLAAVAEKAGMSRNDYLEALAEGSSPFMEMVQSQSQPLMETVETERKVDEANIEKQLGNSSVELENLNQELVALRSQLEIERADRKQLEAQLSEKEQNRAPAATLSEKSTRDAATILSQLRARRKKSKADLADLEAILEILES